MKPVFKLSIPTIGYNFQISLETARDILGEKVVIGYNQRTICIRMHVAYFEDKSVVRLDINGRWFYISENSESEAFKICKGIIGEDVEFFFNVNEVRSEWVKYTTDVFVQFEIVE